MALRLTPHKLKKSLLILASMLLVGTGIFYYQQPSQAADLRNFDAGNIMSDAVMSNKDSMTVAQIQAFLESKNACNNTNIHMASWYPHLQYNIKDGKFVCMHKETFDNGQTAAQIIWQAGQDYNINPQVLIVLLQKEQGLVTDTWPNHRQYRSATGYGCPDTAPCDSQYYGLKNQLRKSAQSFRSILNGGWSNYPVGNNSILYNPNRNCGSSVVNIKNRATSALYNYTPYQPNQSALNAGYGTGDSCGAYGNRNFWLWFTDWFGNTQLYDWVPMVESRWMKVNTDTKKTNLDTGNEVDDTLPAGQHLKLIDKTTINGKVFLRTEWDYNNNIPKGILLSDLVDIEYEPIAPQWMITNYSGIHKYNARQDKWIGLGDMSAQFPIGTVVKIVDKITINDRISYRTEFDSSRNIDLTFPENRLSSLGSVLELDNPRDMQAIDNITPIKLDGGKCSTVGKNTIVGINGKAIINGGLYFSKTISETNPNDFCFISSKDVYWDIIEFTNFEDPREMTLNRTTDRINLYTGSRVDTLPLGLKIHFSTKIIINNTLYYRTTFNGSLGEPYGIPAKYLSEV